MNIYLIMIKSLTYLKQFYLNYKSTRIFITNLDVKEHIVVLQKKKLKN